MTVNGATDPAAIGAAVTTALCGHWEHDGPCRWPHNSAVDGATFRTVFVAPADEAGEVRRRIEAALRGSGGWSVGAVRARAVSPAEQALAERLEATPLPR